jgi:hypothetical protein
MGFNSAFKGLNLRTWARPVALIVCRMISPATFPESIHPSIHLWHYNPFRALASLISRLHSSLFAALLLHPLIPSSCVMFEHSMYRKSIPFPCSHVVVYLLVPSEASLRFSELRFFFSGVGSSPPRPIPNLEDQGVPFCVGRHLWPVRLGRPCQ